MIAPPDWVMRPVTGLYRRMLPLRVRLFIYRIHNSEFVVIKKAVRYLKGMRADDGMREILSYLPFAECLQYPYAWTVNIRTADAVMDDSDGHPYVVLDGKKCYFPKGMSADAVSQEATFLNYLEQHERSPHRYLTADFDVTCDDIVADCGGGDGNFGLSVVDRVKKLYVFEPDEKWQEPLRKTFGSWADKVEIVQKFVSDTDSDNSVTLDGFFKNREKTTFLKIDVEGYERNVLNGASELLNSSVKKVAVCTYHLVDDHDVLSAVMVSKGFSVSTSKGYMLTSFDGKEPYIRHVLIRCSK